VNDTAARMPHDPFTVDVQAVLEALADRWGTVYKITFTAGRWRATRKDGTGEPLAGRTPDDLTAAMRSERGTW
jgi:hypothetical protein